MNPRINKKEQGLIKGALRRVFSRSDLRRKALSNAKANYSDESRPRVKTWYYCSECKKHYAGFQMQVDHIDPIIPTYKSLEEMTWDSLIDRLWCDPSNLVAICLTCHKAKSKVENAERRKLKKERIK